MSYCFICKADTVVGELGDTYTANYKKNITALLVMAQCVDKVRIAAQTLGVMAKNPPNANKAYCLCCFYSERSAKPVSHMEKIALKFVNYAVDEDDRICGLCSAKILRIAKLMIKLQLNAL